jgi:integrase
MKTNANARGLLSLAAILSAPDGDHADGNRLLLRVRGAAASWVYRYTSPATGKRREIGLGSAKREDSTRAQAAAAKAREMALEYELKLLRGTDPAIEIEDRKRAQREKAEADEAVRVTNARTLGRAIRDYHELEIEASPKFTAKYKAQWLAPFENHLRTYKAGHPDDDGPLWRKPIAQVSAVDLLDFLKDMQRRLPHTARKMRQRLDAVLEHGRLHGWNTERPTQAIVRALKKAAPSLKNRSHRKARWQDAPALYQQLQALDSTASRCLRFTVLTAARTNEAINAEWSEIDLQAATWILPSEKMKGDEEHRVDLPPQALAILKQQEGLHTRWVFPSPSGNGKALSSMGMLMALRRLKVQGETTVHGLARGTFSTWANENGIARPDVIEAALAHREADLVRAAYNTAKFFEERRQLLRQWAAYLEGQREAANEEQTEQQVAA